MPLILSVLIDPPDVMSDRKISDLFQASARYCLKVFWEERELSGFNSEFYLPYLNIYLFIFLLSHLKNSAL